MSGWALDDLAWTGRWTRRSTAEKALLSTGLLLVAATSPSVAVSAGVFTVAVGTTLAVARVRPAPYLLAWAGPAAFIALGAATVALTIDTGPSEAGPGASAALLRLGPLVVTDGSAQSAGQVLARSLAGVAAILLLAATTPLSDLLHGLRRLRVPGAVLDVAALMYRMVFGLAEAVGELRATLAARLGFVDGRAARHSVGLLAAASLRRAWARAGALEQGLAGRGYTGDLAVLTAARPVSVPFVVSSAVTVAGLAAWSVLEVLG